jgi:branched-chain amino acid transport system substrate-binding protein
MIKRRTVLLGMPGFAAAQARLLRIGSTFDDSGVERANGSGCHQGALACFESVNRSGGIRGSKLELVKADDQFNPDVARRNVRAFEADRSVLGLLSPLGTRQTLAVMEAATSLPIVGPYTGTAALRRTSPTNVFWVRATYDEEVERLIANAVTLGVTRVGIVYPDDPFGRQVLEAFTRSMESRRLKPAVLAKTPGTTSKDVNPAVKAVAASDAQLVIMSLAGVAPLFVDAYRAVGGGATLYGLSISASAANVKSMGQQSRGVGFAIVVPSPFSRRHELVRRYQSDMSAAGVKDLSLPSLEGYVNARVMVEGLRRAGTSITRDSLHSALAGIEALDLGGMRIGYGRTNRIGGHFVDVAVVGQHGQLLV